MKCDFCGQPNLTDVQHCASCGGNLFKSKLRVVYEDGRSETHYLFGKNYRIGRGKKNDIDLRDISVSRHHAEIAYEAGTFTINDKNSKNGSLLNDLPFESSSLKNDDCIQLGSVLLYFLEEPCSHRKRNLDTIGFVQQEYLKLAEKTNQKISTGDVLKTVLELASSLVHAEQAVILQVMPSGEMKPKVERHAKNDKNAIAKQPNRYRPLVEKAIQTRQMQIEFNGTNTPEPASSWRRIAIPLVPLQSSDKRAQSSKCVLGVCLLSRDEPGLALSKRKKELLSAMAQQLTLALENELLHDASEQSAKINQELALAKEIQQRLLPVKTPEIDQCCIVTFVQPCEAVSGDYFDIIRISDSLVGLAIGDVCGKGIPAALLSSTVQAAIRSQLDHTVSTAEIVHNLNKLLLHNTAKSIFLTLFFGILDLEKSEFRFINAGHPPPYCISKTGKIVELTGSTPPLGILETNFDAERCVRFECGETIIMYTDGIIESHDPNKQIYGRKRFGALINAIYSTPRSQADELDHVVGEIRSELTAFIDGARQTDDLTILAVKRT